MDKIDLSRYEPVYFNHGNVNQDTVIGAFITVEHWLIVGDDWWQMGKFSWSDIPKANCDVVNLGDINLREVIKDHSWSASHVLLAISLARAEII